MTSAADITRAYPRAASVAHAVVSLSRQLGIDPAWLANVVQFESTWNPQARNRKTRATGLIQFMPNTARGLGTTVDALRRMTAAQQWEYVARYFRRFAGRLRTQEDVFMAVFYPVALGKPATWRFPAKVSRYNPGIYTPADYARKALRRARLSPSSVPVLRAFPSLVVGPGAGDLERRRRRLIIGVGAGLLAAIAVVAAVARRRMG